MPPGSRSCFLSPPAREMSRSSKLMPFRIVCHLFRLLSGEEPCQDLPALAFFVEVSPMASAASLSCLPALCPLVAAAARDGARALCCCLGPALHACGLVPAGSPVTPLCLSGPLRSPFPALAGLEWRQGQRSGDHVQEPAERVQGEASPGAQRPCGAQQGSLHGEKGAAAEAALAAWGWGTQSPGLGWASGTEAAVPSSPASRFSCPSASGQVFGLWALQQQGGVAQPCVPHRPKECGA